jgi:hypothetical protein
MKWSGKMWVIERFARRVRFAYFNRRRDRVKILVWDKNGFWLIAKHLECGTLEQSALQGDGKHRVEVERSRLLMLPEGIKKMACGFRNRERFRDAIYFHLSGLDLHHQLSNITYTNF